MAGFLDSAGGGGWGPVATTPLLSRGRLEPRRVVGSVDTSEFLVALAASLGFLWFLGSNCSTFGGLVGSKTARPDSGYRRWWYNYHY